MRAGWLAAEGVSWCCRYIYQNKSGGVHDYLCNKLYEVPEPDIERYLSQFCQLIVARPGSALERVIIDLCARSLRIAVKVRCLQFYIQRKSEVAGLIVK